jgi:hypothetical protein
MVHDLLMDAIESSGFNNLLKAHGFTWVFDEEYVNDGRHTQYFVGFESQKCRIAVGYELGSSIAVVLGRLAGNFRFDQEWVDLNEIISYIRAKPFEFNFSKKVLLKDVFQEYLTEAAKNIDQYSSEIFPVFSDDISYSNWKRGFDEYKSNEIKRRIGR